MRGHRQASKQQPEAALVEGARRQVDHCLVETHLGIGHDPTVDVEKHQRRVERGSLVAVDEWLVFGDVVGLRCGHMEQVVV